MQTLSRYSLGAWLRCGLVMAACANAQQAQPESQELDAIRVKPNFYMIAGAGGNIAVQVGPLGAVLVDTGASEMSEKVLAAVNRLSSEPIRYIINTSSDRDHVGGNQKLSKAGITILSGSVGQRGIDEGTLTNGGAASILAHENVLLRMSEPNGMPEPFWPTKAYSGRGYSMYLNDSGIQILYQAAAHSDGDSVVIFRQADVIVAGDIIDSERFPVIDPAMGGSIQGEIDALNRLLDLIIPPFPLVWQEARTYVLPGHGRVMDQHDVVDYRDMLTIVRDLVQDLVNQGMTLQQVKAANPTKAYRTRYGADSGAWTTDMFVAAVYQSLVSKK